MATMLLATLNMP